MKLGLQIPSFTWPGGAEAIRSNLKSIAATAEEAGFYSLWVMDHFFQIEMVGKAEEPMLEGYSALNFLAAATENIRLGVLVTGVIYRYPGILVKTATTLDVLSGGRSYFGIGAGWYEREAVGLGIPFPPLRERFERLEETVQIALQMWSGHAGPFSGKHYHLAETLGKHYHLAETLGSPLPIAKPHPPIMIGGGGEKRTLALVAKYADACNLYAFEDVAAVSAKLDVLRRHSDACGRSYDDIEKTAIGSFDLRPGGTRPRDALEHCRRLAAAGIQHFIVSVPGDYALTPVQLLGREVIPALKEL